MSGDDSLLELCIDLQETLTRIEHKFPRCIAIEVLDKDWFSKEIAEHLHMLGWRKIN